MESIARIAKEFDLLVLADEVYETLVYSDSVSPMIKFGACSHFRFLRYHNGLRITNTASLPGMFERTITVGSVGKMFGVTGWKVGWILSTPEIVRSVWMVHQFVPFAIVTPLQVSPLALVATKGRQDANQ